MRWRLSRNSGWIDHVKDEIPDNIHLRAKFFSQQLADSLAPTNHLGSNPQALRRFIESGGDSILAGIRMAREDVKKGNGKLYITQTDETPFKLGDNIATAPGEVVFRNDRSDRNGRVVPADQNGSDTSKCHFAAP